MFRPRVKNIKKKKEKLPTDLKSLGFIIGTSDKVIGVRDGGPYIFKRTSSTSKNERFYIAMIEALRNEVISRLQAKGFQTVEYSNEGQEGDPQSFFMTRVFTCFFGPDISSKERIIFLIPSALLPFGIWSTREAFEQFSIGTVMGFVTEAQSRGFAVVIPNLGEIYWQENKMRHVVDASRPYTVMYGDNDSEKKHLETAIKYAQEKAPSHARFYALGGSRSPEVLMYCMTHQEAAGERFHAVVFATPNFIAENFSDAERRWLANHSLSLDIHGKYENTYYWGGALGNACYGCACKERGEVAGHHLQTIFSFLEFPESLPDKMKGAPIDEESTLKWTQLDDISLES